jgi:hypothetical protein
MSFNESFVKSFDTVPSLTSCIFNLYHIIYVSIQQTYLKYIYFMQHKGGVQFIYNSLQLLQWAKSQLLH